MSDSSLTIFCVHLINGRTVYPSTPRPGREHTIDEGGVTFFVTGVSLRQHVPWTSILTMETKA